MSDIIDTLAGLDPGSPLALIRDRKPITRQQAQASHGALFAPADPGDVPISDRYVIATFISGLHGDETARAFYAAHLPPMPALSAEIERAQAVGPYGAYPKGPLSPEDLPGPDYKVAHADALGPRLSAALTHVHMLVFHPRDANAAALDRLLAAGWSTTGIVTLSQLVSFLAFQIRAAAGLRVLAGAAS